MKMKTIRICILCFAVLFFLAPLLCAQDFSRYRSFVLGTSLDTVLKNTDQKLSEVKMVYDGSATFQELTWWPTSFSGASYRSDSVEQILFSFYKGDLYKISVTYDRKSTEGLTTDDMVKSISAKYGPPTSVALAIDSTTNDGYDTAQQPVASWENSQYSLNLVRSVFSGDLGLVIYTKGVKTEAEAALADAVKLEQEEKPQREAARQKKETDARELTRQKNQKSFRP
jgi:hypothetical protein